MKRNKEFTTLLIVISSIIILAIGTNSKLNPISAATFPLPQKENSCAYTIQKGDTLTWIASRLTGKQGNYKQIMQLNALTSDIIHPGDQLHIPNQLLLEEYQCKLERTPTPAPASTPTTTSTVLSTPTPTVTPIPTLTPPPKESQRKIPVEIEGIVFEDKNGNEQYDSNEPGIPGVEFTLIRGRVYQPSGEKGVLTRAQAYQTSNEQGRFLFVNVEPGEQAVGLHETSLPEGYRLMTNSTVIVSLTEGDKGFVEFGLRKISETPEKK
jgi:LysM repeat protein